MISADDLVQQGLNNLKKCSDALLLEVSLVNCLRNGYFKSQCSLLTAEETLLALASTDDVDGIFFCCIVGDLEDDSEKKYCMARLFESGVFSGFYQSNMHAILKAQITDPLIPYFVFTGKDVKSEKERSEILYVKRRKGKFSVIHMRNLKLSTKSRD